MKIDIKVFVLASMLFVLVGLLSWSTQSIVAVQESSPTASPIHLINGTIYPEAGTESALNTAAAMEAANGRIHVIMQFNHIPNTTERAQLAAQGIELLNYIPENTWIASVPTNGIATLTAQSSSVRWVGAWHAEAKMAPRLQTGDYPTWAIHENGRIQLMMLLHGDVPLAEGEAIADKHDAIIAGRISTPRALTVWVAPENIATLAAEEGVLWLEEAPPPLTTNNDDARETMNVPAVHGLGLDGSGVSLFIFDGGTVDAHNGFNGRLTVIDGASASNHPTHVAGTAAGDGTGDPGGRDLKGMAPNATIISAAYEQSLGNALFWDNAGDIEADYALARNTHGIDLSNNSIGSNTAANGFDCDIHGDYGVSSAMLDGIVRGDNATVGSGVIMSWANGNERTGGSARCGSNFHTTAPPSCAKNPIHVGATNSDGNSMTTFSSWGPCDDGRLKPIVSGPGCESGLVNGESYIHSTLTGNTYGGSGWCGTSMAAPAVAGVMTLAIEQFRITSGNPSARPSNALMKAWLIHTTQDLGIVGPDYIYGYGEVDAKAVIDLVIDSSSYQTATISTNGETDAYSYVVPIGAGEFKVSLAWDDKAASAFAANALVNNLNLEVVDPAGTTTYHPFSLDPNNPENAATSSSANGRDNQEQVIIINPTAGNWTIRVVGASVPDAPQTYALVNTHTTITQQCGSNLITNSGFESGTSGWFIDTTAPTAQVVAAPVGGSGDALQVGGDTGSSVQEYAYQQITVPTDGETVTLSFDWYLTSDEAEPNPPWDQFDVIVTNTSNTFLKALDIRSNAWKRNEWYGADTLDLSEFAGQTIRLYFRGINDSSFQSTFYVDNVSVISCESALRFEMTSSNNIGEPGEILTFTLDTTNVSGVTANNIILTSTVPANTTLNPGSLSGDASSTGTTPGSTITWNTGESVTNSSSLTRTFDVTVDPSFTGEVDVTIPASISASNIGTAYEVKSILISDLKYLYLPLILNE
ncbi:MAG: S8 family serine peptidase [Chloroflexi bacterium]|nr:S8 family serine peptidase [Chloroflexota bacterium]